MKNGVRPQSENFHDAAYSIERLGILAPADRRMDIERRAWYRSCAGGFR
jgi:hypothetical protein